MNPTPVGHDTTHRTLPVQDGLMGKTKTKQQQQIP